MRLEYVKTKTTNKIVKIKIITSSTQSKLSAKANIPSNLSVECHIKPTSVNQVLQSNSKIWCEYGTKNKYLALPQSSAHLGDKLNELQAHNTMDDLLAFKNLSFFNKCLAAAKIVSFEPYTCVNENKNQACIIRELIGGVLTKKDRKLLNI